MCWTCAGERFCVHTVLELRLLPGTLTCLEDAVSHAAPLGSSEKQPPSASPQAMSITALELMEKLFLQEQGMFGNSRDDKQ